MKARFLRFAGVRSRARRASTVGLFLTLFASAAQAQQGTPEQRRACTPTSTGSAPAKSPTSAPSQPACAVTAQA